jgi:hypothetical protein
MKKIKKNLFGIGLALAMIMGVVFSFVPKNVNAEQGGDKIYCYSNLGSPPRLTKVIGCADCTWVKANNPSLFSQCTRNTPNN